MRKLNNKGFTLVEIVIVIVIIAILAAMLVPALTQWIDKSKKKTFTSACGTIKTSVWSQIAEQYAVDNSVPALADINWVEVTKDVGKGVSNSAIGTTVDGKASQYQVTAVDYSAGTITIKDSRFTGTYNGTAWTVSP